MTKRCVLDVDVLLEEEQPGGTLQWSNLAYAILVAVHRGDHQAVHASIRDAREAGWDQ